MTTWALVNDSQVCNRNAGEAVHWPVHQWRNERTRPQFTRHLLAAAAIGRADPVALIGDGSRPTTRAADRAAIDLQARALDLSAAMLVGPAAAFANMARSLGSRRRLAFVWWQNLAATSGCWSLAPRSPRGCRSLRSHPYGIEPWTFSLPWIFGSLQAHQQLRP